MRIAVVGSREYPRPDAVRQFVWEQERTTVIVSGGALGVDQIAVAEARRLHMPYEEYLPDWNRYGKRAGAIRNAEIVKQSDEVVAFWNGTSRGTQITIGLARTAGKPTRIYDDHGVLCADEGRP